jgi:neutral ceramidase
MNRREFITAMAATGFTSGRQTPVAPRLLAGVATADITPETSLWMAGFARRTQPSQGVAMPLHAKALAFRHAGGQTCVLVTTDLLGLTARITDRVAAVVQRRHGLRRSNLLFNASHTHCGPIVDEQLSVAYDLSSEQWRAIRDYSGQLEDKLAGVIDSALSGLQPARLSYGRDEAAFATNRRVKFGPGPVDRSVPVLRVDDGDGTTRAIVFGYACHNTTLQDGFVRFHGDYAGVAQAALEQRHHGATALFVTGCGADANPMPRGTLDLVNAHGSALADAVDRALRSVTPIDPAIKTAYGTVALPFAGEAIRERWRRQLDIEQVYLQRHAALMRAAAARGGNLPAAARDPVQVWQFGSATSATDAAGGTGLTLVALGGEVVVDYVSRLAREFPQRRLWVAGYSNDVFGYVPSARVLREGGYEGADAMIYYGRPGPFAEGVEELIVGEVRRLAGRVS